MTRDDFMKLVEQRFEKCRNTLGVKKDEYAKESDAFHNFKMGAGLLGRTPLQVALYYSTKHIVSIRDMIESERPLITQDAWDEKIGDAINYLLLMDGMFHEVKNG